MHNNQQAWHIYVPRVIYLGQDDRSQTCGARHLRRCTSQPHEAQLRGLQRLSRVAAETHAAILWRSLVMTINHAKRGCCMGTDAADELCAVLAILDDILPQEPSEIDPAWHI